MDTPLTLPREHWFHALHVCVCVCVFAELPRCYLLAPRLVMEELRRNSDHIV